MKLRTFHILFTTVMNTKDTRQMIHATPGGKMCSQHGANKSSKGKKVGETH